MGSGQANGVYPGGYWVSSWLGNIWKFPYITGENGGGAFVLVYLICIAAIGVPIMISEIMLGRRGRQSLLIPWLLYLQKRGGIRHGHY